jgi:hypothetical protein
MKAIKMALNRLSIAQMVNLTKDWVKPKSVTRQAFERVPSLSVLLSVIEVVHEGVLVAERVTLTKDITELKFESTRTDAQFDNLVRGIIRGFDSEIFLARARGDYELAQALEVLRDFLFPLNMKTVTLSYREESGHTDLVAARLKPEHRTMLASMPVINGNLLGKLEDWMQAGQKLGELEDERANVISPNRMQNAADARSQWIQMVQTVYSVVRMTNVQEPDVLEALHRIERAELAAERSSDGSNSTDEPPIEPPIEPSGKLSGKSAGKSAGKLSGKSARKSAGKSARKPSGKPSGKPSSEPSGKPSSKPSGEPSIESAGEPAVASGEPAVESDAPNDESV